MIFLTLTIREFSPGKTVVDLRAPPGNATVREIQLAEKIRAAIAKVIEAEAQSGSTVCKIDKDLGNNRG